MFQMVNRIDQSSASSDLAVGNAYFISSSGGHRIGLEMGGLVEGTEAYFRHASMGHMDAVSRSYVGRCGGSMQPLACMG